MFHIPQEAVVVPHPPTPDTFFLQPRLPQQSAWHMARRVERMLMCRIKCKTTVTLEPQGNPAVLAGEGIPLLCRDWFVLVLPGVQ